MGMVSHHIFLGDEFAFSNSLLIREELDLVGGPLRGRRTFCFYHILFYKNLNSFFSQCPTGDGLCFGPNCVFYTYASLER